ncbi:hypothetical protein CAC42_1483 [Sphaceloma murrayae]|uniref:Vacuolar protein sorting-associated protein 29 n=1 Tax=Sphaceloma murrayae TaxID=2082308 RepID=A0A2K1QY99_9PEZI|nr:hypothetical protein CAC42_1483 [Sphaceloma murrayae]
MPYSLKGRRVLITGGSRGLGAAIAHAFAAEGSNLAINYASNEAAALSLTNTLSSTYGIKTIILKGDVGKTSDCEALVNSTIKAFGGLDIVIGNAGWTKFSDFSDLYAMTDAEWDKCWNVNVKGQLALLRAAMPSFKENREGGVFLITSSIAGSSIGGSSMAYSVTKAAQLHLMKCLAKTQGEKLRINAVLPGLLLTEWGLEYGDVRIKALKDAAALKKEVDMTDCANVFVMLAKNTSMTGQKFKKLLTPNKIGQILCLGNLTSPSVYTFLRSLAPDLQLVKGDFDIPLSLPPPPPQSQPYESVPPASFSAASYPIPTALSKVVTHGSLRIGFTHGHTIIPPGDPDSLLIAARQMDVDVLCWGGTSRFEAYELEGKFFVNPGSATGAASWTGDDLDDEEAEESNGTSGGRNREEFSGIDRDTGEQKGLCPSFVLMDVQGDVLVLYVYQLRKDGEGKEAVAVEKVSFRKGGSG